MPELTDLRPGDPEWIARYQVVGRLGAGAQGVVFLATAPDGEKVAIKQLRSGPGGELADDHARRQFAKEVASVRRVAAFCTAQVLDVQLDGPHPYVVSEFVEGPSLQQQVRSAGPMTGVTLQRLAIGTVTALAAIHQAGVVHRDFKPANVMLSPDGPRVIDFGIARDLSTEMTMTSRIVGTPAYMAPEQLRSDEVGPPADMFAWACVLVYAATGHGPFDAPHVMAVVHRITTAEPDLTGVPVELVPVLLQCLSKDPARRPTAQQALAQLLGRPAPAPDPAAETRVLAEATEVVRSDPAPTRPLTPVWGTPRGAPASPPASPPVGRGRSRNAGLIAGAALVALVLAGLALPRLLDRGGDDGTPVTSAPSTPVPTTTAAPATRAPSGPATVPAGFDGTWEGRALQPDGTRRSWTARIELDEGETSGDFEWKELDCSGSVAVTEASDRALSLHAVVDENDSGVCAPSGTVRLALTAGDRVVFTWQDDADPANRATGVLRHS